MIVAKRNPAGAPRPFPKPTAIGVVARHRVIGAALATAMKRTATIPIAPFFRPAGAGFEVSCVGAIQSSSRLSVRIASGSRDVRSSRSERGTAGLFRQTRMGRNFQHIRPARLRGGSRFDGPGRSVRSFGRSECLV